MDPQVDKKLTANTIHKRKIEEFILYIIPQGIIKATIEVNTSLHITCLINGITGKSSNPLSMCKRTNISNI